ncbi:MAG: hypothetical protein PHE78_03940 [Candidatus Gastranaerophilales bacterium]|nr:hypothetical protein [Candidatus Gastranaerophilales bacterium]
MIFSDELKSKYPFASRFFELALTGTDSKLANGFILYGNNISYQYKFVLEIAKYLNCAKDKSQNCDCTNCNWITENAHPAVITISPIDYIDKPKTKISVDQIRKLRSSLGVTSPYHRVIIITDAKEIESELPFAPPRLSSDEKDRLWTPFGLNYNIFGKSPANALLKVLEEPSDCVTFFFLTKSKDDLLPTIVSRCQSVSLVASEPEDRDLTIVREFVERLPYSDEKEAMNMIQKWQNLSKEYPQEELLNMMQKIIKINLNANVSNRVYVLQLMELLKKIETAKEELTRHVQPQNVVQSLFLSLRK